MASIELDSSIKQALKFLHSSARDSTEQVRLLLDEVIKQNCGSSKTMSNVLPKKYLSEDRSDGSHKPKHKSDKQSQPKISPAQGQSPQRLEIQDDVMDGELAFDLLEEDLTCVVCRQIAVQAGNRLVECDTCHALYHQDCHKPVISDNDVSSGWQCVSCLSAQTFTMGNYSMTSLKSVPVTSQNLSVKTSPMRQPSSTTSIKLVTSTSSSSSGSSKIITPNINIISADKRLQIMKKKAAKQQEIKRKHVK